ncbi:DUF58 domain-containing protein [Jeotgalibacillus haloalkalitolerans]|uniref:DUF58 domain-containing protein n=1 Tax=Jeotgalibacillus haloalkalitolerans TaxID=3104292 RepID=A0ABU5KP73_9BACL|nr:DUF58 domain-containing protein [Jeotgalibacillus sp. HH7-29]MDZ5712934.1 DUF58 domain-containing protein [Jeotgalibacillus sp. HH7-29]
MWLEARSSNRHILVLEVLTFISGLLFFLGSQFAVSAVFIIILIFIRFYLHYSQNAGSDLVLVDEEPVERLTVNDESEWSVVFKNGKYPLRNVSLTLGFTNHAVFMDHETEKAGNAIHWNGHLSLDQYEEVRISIPFEAIRRGKMKMVSCQLYVPHLFGYGYKILQYKGHFKQEKRIYPEIEKVNLLPVPASQKPGEEAASFSLYEDLTLPAGTREYRMGDTMQRINWSAFAKTGQLQTNLYEPVIEEKYMLILNVTYKHAKNIHFEKFIKQAAYIMTEAHRKNQPFGLCVNVRTKASPNFYFIAPDRGVSHTRRCLEMLSVLSLGDATLPVNVLLNQLAIMQVPATDYILIGDIGSAERLLSLKGRVWTVSGGATGIWKQQSGIH